MMAACSTRFRTLPVILCVRVHRDLYCNYIIAHNKAFRQRIISVSKDTIIGRFKLEFCLPKLNFPGSIDRV